MKLWMLFLLVLLNCLAFSNRVSAVTSYQLHSPDNRIQVTIRVDERITYDVTVNGKLLLQNSTISLIKVDHHTLGKNAKVSDVKTDVIDRTIEPVVKQKFAKIREHYNELRLSLAGNFALTFRAYNEGVAYRLETSLAQTEIFGSDYKKAVQTVDRNSKLKIHMMGGGGWAARFVPSATQ